ncbi:sigma factor-like helix-turn-helix DNA-binding protein [uncultured Campylobacter sp.]|uniref:sigma factor-like helix-turn-helix DNA-binding protein n=1 Tax=uncultured Campylobacter sp. TaxID=218934 RepID=UPI002614E588|nr:sigma factor-like helix-turn-helix DNA-binding protein [uncultured Campylobacter sp.]
MTLKEIAQILGLSTERVRQIERSALAKLAHPRNRKKWEEIKETMAMIQKDKVRAGLGDVGSYAGEE